MGRKKAYYRDILSFYGMSKDEYATKARLQEVLESTDFDVETLRGRQPRAA